MSVNEAPVVWQVPKAQLWGWPRRGVRGEPSAKGVRRWFPPVRASQAGSSPRRARRRSVSEPSGSRGQAPTQAKPAEMVSACVSTAAFGPGRKRQRRGPGQCPLGAERERCEQVGAPKGQEGAAGRASASRPAFRR